jgi:hypothetical protein
MAAMEPSSEELEGLKFLRRILADPAKSDVWAGSGLTDRARENS